MEEDIQQAITTNYESKSTVPFICLPIIDRYDFDEVFSFSSEKNNRQELSG